jgi:hypothetical protein
MHGQSCMAEDDIVHLIDDPATSAPSRSALEDRGDRRRAGGARRHALSRSATTSERPGLEILSAYSAAEGRELMRTHPTSPSCCSTSSWRATPPASPGRVHPQGAQERDGSASSFAPASRARRRSGRVIVDYDINDYKAKTELTADKLFTALTAALRSHQQLERMVQTRRGPRDHHRGGVGAVRLQVDATAGGGCPHPDRIAAQCRLRGDSGAA